jgi:hypothetical protein
VDDPVATSRRESDLVRELVELGRAERDEEPPFREQGKDAAAADPPAPVEVA